MSNAKIEYKFKKFKVTVKMKKPWILISKWGKRPDADDVFETFADEIIRKEIDDYFEITIEEEK